MHFFDPDSTASRFLTRIFDLILLNGLFVITSLPVITIGASLTALYRMTLHLPEGTEGPIVRGYFSAFRRNFKPATLVWLPALAILTFLGADLYIIFHYLDKSLRMLQIPVWILLFLTVSVLIYAFPLLSEYENTIRGLFRNSILLSLANVPFTIFVTVILTVLVSLSLMNIVFRVTLFSLLLFIGCSLLASFFSLFLTRIFQKARSDSGSQGVTG